MTETKGTTAIRERIAIFTAECGAPEPALAYEDGEVLLTDELKDWHAEHGAPLDWILFGDVRSLLREHRARREKERRFADAFERLDDEARTVLMAGLHAHAAGVPMEDAMAAVRETVAARRAKAARAA